MDPTWDSFFANNVTLNGTKIPKFSQNFLILSQNFQKSTLRGTDFSVLVFLVTLCGTGGGEKRYPDQLSFPVPLFALVPPGLATVINTVKNNSLKTLFVRYRNR